MSKERRQRNENLLKRRCKQRQQSRKKKPCTHNTTTKEEATMKAVIMVAEEAVVVNKKTKMEMGRNQYNWRGGPGRGGGDRAYRPNVNCYNCGKFGHYARDCRSPKKVEENTNFVTEEEANDNGVLLTAYEDTISDNDNVWYLDTGASNHMSGHKHLFVEIQESKNGHMSFGDASKIEVKGRGKIHFLHNGKDSAIENVYYVPNMKINILSMGQLMEKGYSVFMKDRMMNLIDKRGRSIACVEMAKNRMYKLNLKYAQEKKSLMVAEKEKVPEEVPIEIDWDTQETNERTDVMDVAEAVEPKVKEIGIESCLFEEPVKIEVVSCMMAWDEKSQNSAKLEAITEESDDDVRTSFAVTEKTVRQLRLSNSKDSAEIQNCKTNIGMKDGRNLSLREDFVGLNSN